MSVILTSAGSTFNRGDFTDGLAFLWSSLDLSPYAGALGRTPHKAILLDAAGKLATGYLAGVGAGETLGSELITNGGFNTDTTGWTPTNATLASIVGGQSGNCLEITTPAPGFGRAFQDIVVVVGALHEGSGYHKSGTSGAETHQISEANSGFVLASGVSSAVWQLLSGYYNAATLPFRFENRKDAGIAGTMLFDTDSVKRVTDPPSTACHIVSSLNGTTRNWASIESGFNPNTITTWSIENTIQVGFGSGLKRRRHVEFIPDGQNVRKRRVLLEPAKEEYDWLLTRKNPNKMTQTEFEKWRRQNPRT